jgi:hypothetical protein
MKLHLCFFPDIKLHSFVVIWTRQLILIREWKNWLRGILIIGCVICILKSFSCQGNKKRTDCFLLDSFSSSNVNTVNTHSLTAVPFLSGTWLGRRSTRLNFSLRQTCWVIQSVRRLGRSLLTEKSLCTAHIVISSPKDRAVHGVTAKLLALWSE